MNRKEMKQIARNISPRTRMTEFDQQDPDQKIAMHMVEILKNTGYDKESGDTIGSKSSIIDLESMNILTPDQSNLGITTWARITIQDKYSEKKNGELQSYEDFWDKNNPEQLLGKRTFWQRKYMTFSIFNHVDGQDDYVYPLCRFSTYFVTKHKSHLDLCIGDMLFDFDELQEDITIHMENRLLNKEGGVDVDTLRMFVGCMLSVAVKAKADNEEKVAKMSNMLGVA